MLFVQLNHIVGNGEYVSKTDHNNNNNNHTGIPLLAKNINICIQLLNMCSGMLLLIEWVIDTFILVSCYTYPITLVSHYTIWGLLLCW